MLKKGLFNLPLAVFLFAVLFAASVAAQRTVCPAEISVTGNDARLTGAAASARNKRTGRVYRAVLRRGMPYFARLPEGNYRVTVTRAGYDRKEEDLVHSCSEDNETWTVALYNLKIPPRRPNTEIVTGGSVETQGSNNADEDPPVMLPKPTPTPKPVPGIINGGVINGKATNLVKPEYPAAARAVRAAGPVNVQVTVDENGNVISASAVSGHPLLRAAAVQAARQSKFSPTMLSGVPVKVRGVVIYNFVP